MQVLERQTEVEIYFTEYLAIRAHDSSLEPVLHEFRLAGIDIDLGRGDKRRIIVRSERDGLLQGTSPGCVVSTLDVDVPEQDKGSRVARILVNRALEILDRSREVPGDLIRCVSEVRPECRL